MNLSEDRVVVVGLGRSGLAVARRARALGATVIGVDGKAPEALGNDVRAAVDELVTGDLSAAPYADAQLVVVSPGVPPFPALDDAAAAGVEVIGELEFAARQLAAPILSITGTNGKSTTTTLLARIVEASGRRVFTGGNIGVPMTEAIGSPVDMIVLEASSFQLERVRDFRPRVAALLNVTEDHLDRYPDFDAYVSAKGNGFVRQGPSDVAVVPVGDARCLAQARRGAGRVVTFGLDDGDFRIDGDAVVEVATKLRVELGDAQLHGRANRLNAAAAMAMARAIGIPSEAIAAGVAAFEPLPHRMARVAVVEGVPFYDDSKGTNVGAAESALRGLLESRAVLIAGGRDKHGDYSPLVEALVQKGRAIVVLGEAADRIAEAVGSRVPLERATSMDDAVSRARALARPGDAVLLSPACSSFDMFRSFSHRGEAFAEAARRLATDPPEAPPVDHQGVGS